MRNLFLFIRRFYPFFLFFFLEVISIVLVSRSNAFQGATMVNSSNRITGSFFELQHNITSYFDLKENNQVLVEENALLREKMRQFGELADSGYVDTTREMVYRFIPATVINHTIHKKMNYFTIDKGTADGIEPGMGVIDGKGLVGMLTNVSQRYAVGISMLNSKTRISVKHDRSGAIGIMRWKGSEITAHIVEDITKTAGVRPGDTMVTSGYSTYFPGDLPVAVVTDASLKEGSNFYDISAILTNDILSLDKVYIVEHQGRPELDSLEASIE